jgi:alpha-tubulin suppressor-like RCC1 family protein
MSGFNSQTEGDLDRIFFTEHELYDRYFGTQLWGCGDNGSGRIGDNSAVNKSIPVTVSGGGTNWKQVSSGGSHTGAIKSDGTLWTWGYNSTGQLGNNSASARSSPGTVSGGGTTWSKISCGSSTTIAIKTDGTLWNWGRDGYGELGDNSVVNKSSPVTVAGGGTTWQQCAGGANFTAAIKLDGTLWTWGRNNYGQLGNNSASDRSSPGTVSGGGTTWKYVSICFGVSTAIKTDGTLWSWGSGQSGFLGNNSTIAKSSPVTTSGGGTNWKQVACGYTMVAAIKTDGTLWTWGSGMYGSLGNNSTVNRSSPGTTSGGGTTWKQSTSGNTWGSAIKTDGTLWTWGYNLDGRLATNTTVSRSSPGVIIMGTTNWKQVSISNNTLMAITM